MKKLCIVYWSGTGNTEKMAIELSEGASSVPDIDVNLLENSLAKPEDVKNCDLLALGCPSMGDEELEESMEEFVSSIKELVKGKKLLLFGSYGWGDGLWMRDWEDRMNDYGAMLIEDGFIVNNEPDDEECEKCKQLGKKLAQA